jgi:hypothetical protein
MVERVGDSMGPLWERDPKTGGIRVVIPDPLEIFLWVRNVAACRGDMTRGEIVEECGDQMTKFLLHQSQRFTPTQRVWDKSIGDGFLSMIHVELSAGYNHMRGGWWDLVMFIHPSDDLLENGRSWEIAKRSNQIAEKLRMRGFGVSVGVDQDGMRHITVDDAYGISKVEVCLGFASREEAMRSDLDFDPAHVDSILIRVGALSVSVVKLIANLQHLQHVSSYAMDAIYEVCGLQPPDVTLELSEQRMED